MLPFLNSLLVAQLLEHRRHDHIFLQLPRQGVEAFRRGFGGKFHLELGRMPLVVHRENLQLMGRDLQLLGREPGLVLLVREVESGEHHRIAHGLVSSTDAVVTVAGRRRERVSLEIPILDRAAGLVSRRPGHAFHLSILEDRIGDRDLRVVVRQGRDGCLDAHTPVLVVLAHVVDALVDGFVVAVVVAWHKVPLRHVGAADGWVTHVFRARVAVSAALDVVVALAEEAAGVGRARVVVVAVRVDGAGHAAGFGHVAFRTRQALLPFAAQGVDGLVLAGAGLGVAGVLGAVDLVVAHHVEALVLLLRGAGEGAVALGPIRGRGGRRAGRHLVGAGREEGDQDHANASVHRKLL